MLPQLRLRCYGREEELDGWGGHGLSIRGLRSVVVVTMGYIVVSQTSKRFQDISWLPKTSFSGHSTFNCLLESRDYITPMMLSVLIVCLGNICRSPMGEAVLKHEAQKRGVNIKVDSAGTTNYHAGDDPDHR